MPYRQDSFLNSYYYHIFNKTIDDIKVFHQKSYSQLIINLMRYYRSDKARIRYSQFVSLDEKMKLMIEKEISNKETFLLEIAAFCFLPNHYHLLIRQKKEGGIIKFISCIFNSLTKTYNNINGRKGPLFLPRFKSIFIAKQELFIHISRYIHLNPYSHGLIKNLNMLKNYRYSSFRYFLKKHDDNLINKKLILSQFGYNQKRYQKFVFNQAEYQKNLQRIKKLTLEK